VLFIVPVLPFIDLHVTARERPRENTLSVHHVGSPFPLVGATVGPGVGTHSLDVVVAEGALIL
jgi:hypothetical protein